MPRGLTAEVLPHYNGAQFFMKELPVKDRGAIKIALVDDDVYEWAASTPWYVIYPRKGYDKGYVVHTDNSSKMHYLHRLIMGAPRGLMVDHRDGNTLNCQRENLRVATCSQNTQNQKLGKRNKSGFKGVNWDRRSEKWRSSLCVMQDGKMLSFNLGYYSEIQQAAQAYDAKAREMYGEFAKTNFPT